MDWTKIITDNPSAWSEFERWCAHHFVHLGFYFGIVNGGDYDGALQVWGHGSDTLTDQHLFNTRDLYDFFDSKGIIIVIEYLGDWGFVICAKFGSYMTEPDVISNKMVSSRAEAESQAFTRAFQILEERLAA